VVGSLRSKMTVCGCAARDDGGRGARWLCGRSEERCGEQSSRRGRIRGGRSRSGSVFDFVEDFADFVFDGVELMLIYTEDRVVEKEKRNDQSSLSGLWVYCEPRPLQWNPLTRYVSAGPIWHRRSGFGEP